MTARQIAYKSTADDLREVGMKLDRNLNPNGMGKYALLKLRELENVRESGPFGEIAKPIADAIKLLENNGIIDWGNEPQSEFFVIRLKDVCAQGALESYADEAEAFDKEYADEISEMASRAGPSSPWCKRPD